MSLFLISVPVGAVVVRLLVVRRFARRVQSVPDHTQSCAPQFLSFTHHEPNHVFLTGRRSHTPHVFVVRKRRRTHQLVVFVQQFPNVKRLLEELSHERDSGVRHVYQVKVIYEIIIHSWSIFKNN